MWAGLPANVFVDGGGEFEGTFRRECETLPCMVHTTAAYSPNQHGVAERHGGWWKSVCRHVLDEHSVKRSDVGKSTWCIAVSTWACNSRMTPSGYSPAQWVLGGCGLRLPYGLLDQHAQLSLQSRAATDDAFNDSIQMIVSALRAVISA